RKDVGKHVDRLAHRPFNRPAAVIDGGTDSLDDHTAGERFRNTVQLAAAFHGLPAVGRRAAAVRSNAGVFATRTGSGRFRWHPTANVTVSTSVSTPRRVRARRTPKRRRARSRSSGADRAAVG